MNTEQLTQYRAQLEVQLTSIKEASTLHQNQIEESQTSKDFVGPDKAAELETLEVDSNVSESEINLVKKIEHALDRIDKGTYGICESCDGEISQERLDAKPSVSLCIDCQVSHEAETA
mgnify:CR=1 FL=1|tara:strand:+ start:3228 stop:3581 length:354 start_codon:yes stop_codon:yes gene_type:complete